VGFPIYPDKYKLPAMVTAGQMLEFRRGQDGLKGLQAPRGAVLCLYNGVIKRLAWRYPSRHLTAFQCDLHLLKRTGGRVAVLGNFGMGAPALVALAEQLIAWGTRRLVILSLAGGLQPELGPGSILVGDGAIRDEGTSYHYLPPAEQVEADPALVAALAGALAQRGLPHVVGKVWSTDAAYRETHAEAHFFQGKGVQAVDMESAGLFAAGRVRQVETASLFVIGDSLAGPRWALPPDMGMIHRQFKVLLDVLIKVLNES
jgi:uridine phosphorylase